MATISLVVKFLYLAKWEIVLLVILTNIYLEWMSYRRLGQFKGPTLAKFSNMWMFNAVASKQTHLALYEVSEKYGEIMFD